MTQNLQKLRDDALRIFQAAVTRVLPQNCIPEQVRRQDDILEIAGDRYLLPDYEHIFVIAFGKASVGMFSALHQILQGMLTRATVITNSLPDRATIPLGEHIDYFEGSHPLPSEQNVQATAQVIELCRSVGSRDLVIFLISGGGSSLLFAPKTGIPPEQYQSLVNDLMKQGATIIELNTIRIVLSLGSSSGQRKSPTDGL
ncbi:MAG: glycerate-2-kinase family protein [Calditrichota bacterium]